MHIYNGIRDVLSSATPVCVPRTEAEERAGVALPGDPVNGVNNPYVGKNPQTVLRLLLSGKLTSDQKILAEEAIVIFNGFSGDHLTSCNSEFKRDLKIDDDVVNNPDFDSELINLFR